MQQEISKIFNVKKSLWPRLSERLHLKQENANMLKYWNIIRNGMKSRELSHKIKINLVLEDE